MSNSLQVMHSDGSFLCFGTENQIENISDTPALEVCYLIILILLKK